MWSLSNPPRLERLMSLAQPRPGLMKTVRQLMPAMSALLLAVTACSESTAPASPTLYLTGLGWTCTTSAAPLPGWRSCPGTVGLDIRKPISSGYVSVYYNYPDAGSFFHGELFVGTGIPGRVTVNVVNDYVSHCTAGAYRYSIDVYNGRQSAQSAPLIATLPTTLNVNCQ